MKRYDEKILQLLIDRYENSLLYRGKNKVNISISVPVNKHTLPEYFDETSVSYVIIHEQLAEMEAKGYLTLVWGKRKKHILEKCVLNPDRADDIYRLLHRLPRKEKECRFLGQCEELRKAYGSEICSRFLLWIRERILSGKPVKEYADLDDPDAFRYLIQILHAIETNQEELFLRQFSIRVFHDSKTAEQEIRKAVRILLLFRADGIDETEKNGKDDGDISDFTLDEVLAGYNIFRNPSWVMLKGTAIFSLRNGEDEVSTVNLQAIPGGMGISNEDVDKICWTPERKPAYIITIENLTSFHQWNAKGGGLCIYLGGYANEPRRKMLRDLYRACPEVPFYHFGDMDCGGFLIWKNLCETTGIQFKTIGMDIRTYEEYAGYGRELTIQDKKKLEKMTEDPFFSDQKDIFGQMLKVGKKIEQECVLDVLSSLR